nr:unnamed protein product [Callosobruchus chinensis]
MYSHHSHVDLTRKYFPK